MNHSWAAEPARRLMSVPKQFSELLYPFKSTVIPTKRLDWRSQSNRTWRDPKGGGDKMKANIKKYVLDAISNDYEDFDMVFNEVAKWVQREGKEEITHEDVARGLEQLINEGYAQAYLLSSQSPTATPITFSNERIRELWFYVTPSGKRLANNSENDLRGKDGQSHSLKRAWEGGWPSQD